MHARRPGPGRGAGPVISDAHADPKASINRVFSGATWKRCKVHTTRNVFAAGAAHNEMVAATVRAMFAQTDAVATQGKLREVVGLLEAKFLDAAAILDNAGPDVTAHATFPRGHWHKIASTNPLEPTNKEIKRCSNVVGIFPDDSVIGLVGAVLDLIHKQGRGRPQSGDSLW